MATIIKFREQSAQRGDDRPDADEPALQLPLPRIAGRQSRIAFRRWSFEERLRNISRRKSLQVRLATLAQVDDSTGLFNRDEFSRQFAQAIERLTTLAGDAIYRAKRRGKRRYVFTGGDRRAWPRKPTIADFN